MAVRYPPQWASLKNPYLRLQTLEFLREIAESTPKSRPDYYQFDIDEVVHFFFDDTDLSRNPTVLVGEVFFDDQEVDAFRPVILLLDRLISELGDVRSEHYLGNELWLTIQGEARNALTQLSKRGTPDLL